MAAITAVFTLTRAAEILGEDENLLWQLSDAMEPEDGLLWIYDVGEQQTLAFTKQAIDNLRELISDQNSHSLRARSSTLTRVLHRMDTVR